MRPSLFEILIHGSRVVSNGTQSKDRREEELMDKGKKSTQQGEALEQ